MMMDMGGDVEESDEFSSTRYVLFGHNVEYFKILVSFFS